ncbi:MAG: diaminopimelate epimerase [Gammaproteobacteria bacterium]|jgi:diaminopimelate epimerase|nr:diaminopimelate epimerase [Gammaproteobacteria bacterium]MBT3722710.1 diaminopimelate epimerase [Gammaproteobacteria bacterium]MBT4078112.1 diaminopimelate epimerase [Gammaproteobacteria bacterium]MBT4195048.1 diaminopimelate epimerase [Gammaproteobacteria bacterium]MBT4452253.1 diaminopimelate epimerase [Gammaproteobacteria bacterium]
MIIKFTKMHGLGNDFMVIDGINQSVSFTSKQVAEWANRHFGIGFDQLLLVEKPQTDAALFKYRIFNSDGGEVTQCGNGARCFARFVTEKGLTDQTIIPVETDSGLLQLKMINATHVEVNMGIPNFEPANIPLDTDKRMESYQLGISGHVVEFSALSIGNPHAVIIVENIDTADVENIGPALESHPFFPQRVNVGFMQILNRNEFKLRVFERGVGETQACGSGACAAMAAAVQLDLIDSNATAHLTGGQLQLSWQGEGQPVMMTGSTAQVYEGEINI